MHFHILRSQYFTRKKFGINEKASGMKYFSCWIHPLPSIVVKTSLTLIDDNIYERSSLDVKSGKCDIQSTCIGIDGEKRAPRRTHF